MTAVTASLLAGAGAGFGLLLIWQAVFPPRLPLATALAALAQPSTGTGQADPRERGWAVRIGRRLVPLLRSAGLPRPGLRADLAICDRTAERHAAEQAAGALAGLALPPAMTGIAVLGGTTWPWPAPALGALALAALGLFVPDMLLRTEARKRRRDFIHALSAFLDITVITLAAGGGLEQALTEAAHSGTGWPHRQLRHCLDVAATTRRALWEPLDTLGTSLDIPAVRELAAALRLAGEEGARIRQSLISRAAALRLRQRTDTEARAQAASERMSLPVAVLMVAFVVFIAYPAVTAVLGDL